MGNSIAQNHSVRQNFGFQARLAGLLEMPEKEYCKLICEIESDPLFMKLKYSQYKPERAIRSRRFQQTDLSHRFYELKESLTGDTGIGGAEVEKLLADKEKLLRTIRKMGEEKFTSYFIYNENGLSLADIAESCGLKQEEAKDILWLVNTVDIHSEFFSPSKTLHENSPSYYKIAILTKTSQNIRIQFTSAHWARGLYEVDYEKIERMTAGGKISTDENRELKKLLEKIEFVNIRKSLMYNIILRLLEKQNRYLRCRHENRLMPFLQIDLARDLKVHPSIISRAIAGRSIETPWGEEKPLKELFYSLDLEQKETVLRYIRDIFKDEKYRINNGELKKPLSDKVTALLLKDKYSVSISQRTVAKYRNLMKLPGAFHR